MADGLTGQTYTELPYFGIIIDTVNFTVSIQQDKVDELMEQMPTRCGGRTVTLRELQSPNEKLNLYSKAIPPACMFTRRPIDLTCMSKNSAITSPSTKRPEKTFTGGVNC